MKTLQSLAISFVICCLFTGNVFACFTGINPNIQGHLNDPLGPPANTVSPGDTIYYEVYISLPSLNCFTYGITGTILLPNGDSYPLPPIADMNPGDTQLLGIVGVPYVVDVSDMGTNGALPGQINAHVQLDGTHITSQDPYLEAPAEGSANYPSVVLLTPGVSVTKEACPFSKVGDTVEYDITITNIGLQDLNLVSVTDSLLGDITAAALGAGCDPLPVGQSCNFQVLREVQPTDPNLLVNIVEVNYSSAITQETVTDDDDAAVLLLHPSFTLDVECVEIIDGTALFEANFCNTGDVGLMVDPDDPDIGDPFPLPVGSECVPFFIQIPVEPGVCGAATASKTISALASIMMPPDTPLECELGNIITPEPAEDTAVCEITTNPCFTVEKNCTSTGPLTEGDTATYGIIVTNCGDVPLYFDIVDENAQFTDSVGPIDPNQEYTTSVSIIVPDCTEAGDFLLNNEVVVDAYCADGSLVGQQSDNADCTFSCGGGEGCTPGYWKNSTGCWCDAYTTDQLLNTVFDFPDALPPSVKAIGNNTLLEALWFKGGTTKKEALRKCLFHAVAAILNACNEDVAYPESIASIVDSVNEILANWDTVSKNDILSLKNHFAIQNELGCPISADNSANPCSPNDSY